MTWRMDVLCIRGKAITLSTTNFKSSQLINATVALLGIVSQWSAPKRQIVTSGILVFTVGLDSVLDTFFFVFKQVSNVVLGLSAYLATTQPCLSTSVLSRQAT